MKSSLTCPPSASSPTSRRTSRWQPKRQAAIAWWPAAPSPGTSRRYWPEERPALAEGGAWEVLHSERLLETPYFTLRSDRLRLPDGAVKEAYYVLERPDAAIIFPLTKEGEVVLVRQFRPPLDRSEERRV